MDLGFLHDCATKIAENNELFLVEVKNASIAKVHRDRWTQALLGLSPGVLKVKGARIDRVLDDIELKSIISALGAGIDLGLGYNLLTLEKLRYWKVILVMEPTKDGLHIRKQVLSFLHQYMNPLIRAGHDFVVPAEDWGSMSPEEFAAKVLDPETREIVQVPGDWGIEEISVNR